MDPTVSNLLNQGVQKKREGQYEEAKRLYRQAMALDPGEYMCYYSMAKTCYLSASKDEAVLNYLRSAHLAVCYGLRNDDPDNADYQMMKEVSLSQCPPDLLEATTHSHPHMQYVLMQTDLCMHLGHALMDLDMDQSRMNQPLGDTILGFVAEYRQGLSGAAPYDRIGLDVATYIPAGAHYLAENIKWGLVESNRVTEIYASALPVGADSAANTDVPEGRKPPNRLESQRSEPPTPRAATSKNIRKWWEFWK